MISYGMEGELLLQITESDLFVVRTLQLYKSSPAGARFLIDPSIGKIRRAVVLEPH